MRKMNNPKEKSCELCNVKFTALTDKQRFCTVKCRRNHPTNKQKEKLNANSYKKRNPLVAKGIKLKRHYGITTDTYYSMLSNQNGVCKICKLTCNTGRELCVDHCHKTGKIRGLLCVRCNNGLGYFQDSLDNLEAAKEYLSESRSV